MRRALSKSMAWIGRFLRDKRAVAAVEFALILPPLLLLFFGTIEGSSLITVDRRVQIVSGTIGDLVARWDPDSGTIPSGTMTDYINASDAIIYPYDPDPMTQVVSLVRVLPNNNTSIVWSCAYGGATAHTANSAYVLPDNTRVLVRDASGYVIVSETTYPYSPVLGIVFEEAYNLYSRSFYLPRYEAAVSANC